MHHDSVTLTDSIRITGQALGVPLPDTWSPDSPSVWGCPSDPDHDGDGLQAVAMYGQVCGSVGGRFSAACAAAPDGPDPASTEYRAGLCYLVALAVSGAPARARAAAGVSADQLADLGARLELFGELEAEARETAADVVRGELWRRSVLGVQEQRKSRDGTYWVRVYDNTGLHRLAEARCPEFSRKVDVSGEVRHIHLDIAALATLPDRSTLPLANVTDGQTLEADVLQEDDVPVNPFAGLDLGQ